MSDEVVAPDAAVIEQNTSAVEARIAGVLAGHRASDGYEECSCGIEHDVFAYNARQVLHFAHVASVVAALPDIAIIEVPSIGFKAEGETDAQRYEEIAGRVERDHHVGGSNSRAAVAELLRRVSESLTARAAGGQQ